MDLRSSWNEPAAILARQETLVRNLAKTALESAGRIQTSTLLDCTAILARGGGINEYMHNAHVLQMLYFESSSLAKAGHYEDALLWGRLTYAASRRFCHLWLPFLDIVVGAGCLPQFSPSPDGAQEPGLIPRTIVQFWDSPSAPPDVMRLIEEWRDRSPGYSHRLFDDVMAREFIGDIYDAAVLQAYVETDHPAGKSDIFRLAWLAEHGGIYIDADDGRTGDVGEILPGRAGFVVNWSRGAPPCVNNWFIACRPKHPALSEALSLAVHQTLEARRLNQRLPPWNLTGPLVLSCVVLDAVATRGVAGMPPMHAETVLADIDLQSDELYRKVSRHVMELAYRSDENMNWKLAFLKKASK
jgi:hypothetical protein